ncbi:MAG: manganese efflux pump [Candidatus Latescibacteria bacterium]|nr:manganese efflux pump [Candidatus Latescibacterota bacterium]
MNFLTIFIIAVALAMDAFAVSIAAGIKLGCVTHRQTFRMSFHFGFFQFIMPVIGWFLGASLEQVISAVDHWIAFALLGFIGIKMIHEAFDKSTDQSCTDDPTQGTRLLGLSIATSIDALAVGLTLGVLNEHIWYPSIIIGLVASGFTMVGIKLGCRIGMYLSKKMEIFGGIILIAIGIKILLDHTIFS